MAASYLDLKKKREESDDSSDESESDSESDTSTDLPEDTDTSEEEKPSSPEAGYQPKTKAGPSYVLVPLNTPKLDTKTDEQVTGSALDLTDPNQLGATKLDTKTDEQVVPGFVRGSDNSILNPSPTASEEGYSSSSAVRAAGPSVPGFAEDSKNAILNPTLGAVRGEELTEPWRPSSAPRASLVDPDPDSLYTGDATAQPEVRRAALTGETPVALPPEPVARGAQVGVTPKAQPVTGGQGFYGGDLSQGPPGTKPDGTEDEPYWPKSAKDIALLPPGTNYIDPSDQSQKVTPGAPPKVQRAQAVASSAAAPSAPSQRQTSLGLTSDEYKAQYINAPTGTAAQPSVATADAGGLNINTDYTADSNSSAKGRGGDGQVHGIILHSSDGRESGDINQLTHGGVSAHYYVTTDGRIYNLVPDGDTAYHAGQTRGQYANYNNSNTIGIEQEHYDPGGKGGANGEAWSPAQVAATAKLVSYLKGKYGLSDNDIMGHSDVAPERKQDPYNYPWKGFFAAVDSSTGAAQPTGASGGKTGQQAGVGPSITGKATTFGYNDPQDNGVGAPKLGQLDTNNKDLIGIAVPEEALRAYVGAHPQSWRTARVQVTGANGKQVMVPIVDLGPRDTSGNVVADFTQGLTDLTGNKGDQNFGFRIIPNAGPDVMKDPQAFADEQAAIKAGINTGARFQAPAAKKPSYVLAPMAPTSPQQEQANQFERQGQIDNLSILSESTSNPVALYKRLDSDVDGVTPAMRQQFQANLKPQVISLMKQSDPSLNDDQAWAKAQTDPNVLDVGVDFWNKFVGSFQQLQPLLQQATGPSVEQSHLDSFLSQALPNGSDSDKHALLTKLYALPPDQRGDAVSQLIPNPQVGVPGQDPQQVVSALDRLSDPNYLKTQADQRAKAQADLKQRMATDPRLAGSPAAFASENLAQIPEMLAAASIPPLMAAQVSQQVRDQMREQHPEYSEQELDQKAAYSTLVQFVGQEAASKLFTAGAGALLQGVKSPVQRAIAQALISTGSGAAIMGGAQAGSNIVTGEPIWQGVPGAVGSGAIMGGATSVAHGAGELRRPAEEAPVASSPEAIPKVNQAAPLGEETTAAPPPPTTGPAGGTVHGASAETMASGGEESVRPVPPPSTAAGVLGPNPTNETAQSSQDDVLNAVAHNIFPDLNESEAKDLADRISFLTANNLETDRVRYELQKFLPQDAPYNFGPTKRLLQAYYAFRDGPTELTAKEISIAQKAYNEARNPQAANMTGALKLPIMWQEAAPLRAPTEEVPPREPAQPSTVPVDQTGQVQQPTVESVRPEATGAAPVNEAEPWVSKIANRFTAERMATGDLGPVEPGVGVTKEEMIARGLKMGPETINQHVSNIMNDVGGNPRDQAAAIRTEEARLSQVSRQASLASEADPGNQQLRVAADNAFKDVTDFNNGPVAKLKNNWHAQGMTLQGEIPVDLSTYNGLRDAYLRDVGKPPPANAEPVLRRTAQRVRDAATAETAAMNKLGAEIEKQSAIRRLPTPDQVQENIMKRMKDIPCPT